jgi:hypothetical protein
MIFSRNITLTISYSTLPNSVKTMIDACIAVCEPLIRNNDTFYPLAAVDLNGDIQAILCNALDDMQEHDDRSLYESSSISSTSSAAGSTTNVTASIGMIERLERHVAQRTEYVQNANSVILYMAFIEAKHRVFTDVIVADVTLYAGASQQYYFPVTYLPGHVTIGPAFTMHAA